MGNTEALGLAILRIVVGIIFFVHGYQKIFRIGFHGVAGMFGHIGIPLPAISAVVVIMVELVGGFLLITGLATRIPAALNAVDMIVAIAVVHARHGFFSPGGYEFPLAMLGATLCLALAGGGAASVRRL
ncbi:MAG: DoxX family protein [Acidobacteria bacterium]|nr:DoxX family protein [Acidobacteriota bacterium]